ncbi:MAG: radical SAM family heme chaperone HemW [Spirochaetaceae bacterium]|nr:radical SAM family heme chaperone HemW [Spirochaetaceae bacterium]
MPEITYSPAALYIHIPFCSKKCDYCDFYSIPVNAATDGQLLDSFIEILRKDIDRQFKPVDTAKINSVYIGGGTPSLLGPRRMKELLDFLMPALSVGQNSARKIDEFTVEVNPESLDKDFLRVCAEGGVTRISCGIQTFNAPSRRLAGRAGGSARLGKALALLGEIYGGAFSADIISGLPFQDEAALRRDMETLLSYKPAHVSLYDLTLEENTPLYQNIISSRVTLPPLETAERLWIFGRDFLTANGYPQYEVSNFAQEGKRSVHNIAYWRMSGWLGAGPSASGTLITDGGASGKTFGLRRTVNADVRPYVSGAEPEVFSETLDRNALIKESFLMGFRYIKGPDAALFKKRFGCGIEDLIPETLRVWRNAGKMQSGTLNGALNIALNTDGLLILNRFLTDCFIELEKLA